MDGQAGGTGRVERTEPFTFSLDETTDVGCETGTVVSDDYTPGTAPSRRRHKWVRLEAGLDSHDHLIDPEHLVQIAMTRQ